MARRSRDGQHEEREERESGDDGMRGAAVEPTEQPVLPLG